MSATLEAEAARLPEPAASASSADRQSGRSASVRYARRFGVPFVLLALTLSAASFIVLLGLTRIEPDRTTIFVVLAVNAIFMALMLALVGREVSALLRARRRGRAAARMHIRIVGLFGVVTSIPAILVALIAGISLDQGLERIFDARTRTIVDNSISVAESYVRAATDSLNTHTVNMGIFLNRNRALYDLDRTGFKNLLSGQARARGLIGAFVLKGDGTRLVGAVSPRVSALPNPPVEMLEQAADGQPSCILPRRQTLAGCAFLMKDFPEHTFFYALTAVDPTVLNTIQLMEEATEDYARLETGRVPLQIAFAVLYVGFCLTILLAAIWMGIAVADRFVEPIRRLIGAADEVAAGNLDVSVPKTKSEGDLLSLTNTFNAMTADLRNQRAEILETQELIDSRRRFTEAVLSGVSAAVIGVGANGIVAISNSSADALFGDNKPIVGKKLTDIAPELSAVLQAADRSGKMEYREQITMQNGARERTLNVQVTVERDGLKTHSHVLTIDDITDLVVAQRTSAWADVARRIAHEIKNPLTPIQLSAERIRRRYGKVITEDRAVFDQCTDTIIRQVEDIGRMVDEFSSFARMPKPQMQVGDLAGPVKEAAFMLRVSNPGITFDVQTGDEPMLARFDSRLMGQVFGNIIKNATEGIEGFDYHEGEVPTISIRTKRDGRQHVVEVIDNGKGLPDENRHRLMEPYMTTREKGTGLGLAIVSKILEEHDGTIELADAPGVAEGGHGACVRVILPAVDAPAKRPAPENGKSDKDGI